ncbi:MAG: DUF5606 domain-containing protein [Bacteroidales bacterium]|nr:DUF5606 domain-containing protein [Bacteroidales bacterium]
MDLKDVLSISGKPGLYRNVAQSKTGVIVESLSDGKRFQVFASDKISALGEISIYTANEDMHLREVFRLMQLNLAEKPAPGSKSSEKELVNFFESIVPDYDKERFYVSHMRKVTAWYNILLENGVTDFSEVIEESAEVAAESPGEEPSSEEKE